LADFRPISVTPILSRLAEKLTVQKWLLPAINHQTINDQFAFGPTGSTTCTCVFLCIMSLWLLETNSYVRCLLIDFSKAFDVVDHAILAAKLTGLNMTPAISFWIFSFLTGRTLDKCVLCLRLADPAVSFSLGGVMFCCVSSYCDLGVTVTSDLSPSVHIHDIVAKAHQRSNAIHRGFLSRNVSLLTRAFSVYARPLVGYNATVSAVFQPSCTCCMLFVPARCVVCVLGK